ncbi:MULTISPECIES: hypothetical protein [Agrobacterium]|uniref:Uncharacterized protein n=1 Tax=Agrobacterium pusense TaxID=648995 RepID=A0AA44EM72_9HYPH|nr:MULTISPECIES: hypothetical protein [Agrobacterium]NRF08005.1 hypothetical protein [Agrobacterium pusense]NRF21090.1 hypothetical protein [Agrobacterium pusense]UXS47689.1 hypothetical protein FY149_13375 [Agrobacterium tumefaciens]
MPIKQSGKRLRVPWRKKLGESDLPITLPVFMAYCAVAGTLNILAIELERIRSIIRVQRAAHEALVTRLVDVDQISGAEAAEIIRKHRRPTVSLAKPQRMAAK